MKQTPRYARLGVAVFFGILTATHQTLADIHRNGYALLGTDEALRLWVEESQYTATLATLTALAVVWFFTKQEVN